MTTTEEHAPSPTTAEIGGVGHSVKRKEDDRFIQGGGQYIEDISLPGMLHLALLRSPLPHARIVSIDASAAEQLPGVVAVVTGEALAAHGLAWMPTLSGDTQAVLATDKVRFQGQEVAGVVAESPYIAWDALELIEVDYDPLPPVINPKQALAADAPLIRDDKEGQTDNSCYQWEAGDKAATDQAFAQADKVVSLDTHYPRSHPAPARDVRLRRRPEPGDQPGDDLHDVAGAARHPHALRHGRRAAGGEHPGVLARHRRRLRQQGADLPRVRGGDGGVAADRQAGEVDRVAQREPDLDGLCPRLPHARRPGREERRHDPRPAREHALRPGRVLRRRPAVEVPGRAVPRRDRLVRLPGRPRRHPGCVHQQGAGRGRVPVLVPHHGGVVPDRAARAERRLRAQHGPGGPPDEELHPARAVPVPHADRLRVRLRPVRRRAREGARRHRLRRDAEGKGGGAQGRQARRCGDRQFHRGRRRRPQQGLRHRRPQDVRLRRASRRTRPARRS